MNRQVRAKGDLVTLTKWGVNDLLDAMRAGGGIDVIGKGVELVLRR